MPTQETAFAGETIDVGIRIDGESIVVDLPPALLGAYLIG